MRLPTGVFAALCVWSFGARAQSTCSVRPRTSFNDGGWIGRTGSVDCSGRPLATPRWVEFTPLIIDGGSFAAVYGTGLSNALPFVQRALYSARAYEVLADGGMDADASVPFVVIADIVAPSLPAIPTVDVDGGVVRMLFPPASDDGQGSVQAEASFQLAGQVGGRFETASGGVDVTELQWDLGPGSWVGTIQTLDVAGNFGGTAVSLPFVVVADGTVTAPAPPVPGRAIYDTGSISVQVSDPADAYHFLMIAPDGGLSAGGLNRRGVVTGPASAFGFFPQECAYRVMAARVVGGRTSNWSAPSTEFQIDLTAPGAPGPMTPVSTASGVVIQWSPAADSCSGVAVYQVERQTTSGWAAVSAGPQTSAQDNPPSGTHLYRVRAVDLAGHAGAYVLLAPIDWPPSADPDAGLSVDAGSTDDAGTLGASDPGQFSGTNTPGDAGASEDAGTSSPRSLFTVGCAASAAPTLFSIAIAIGGVRRRRRPRAGENRERILQ